MTLEELAHKVQQLADQAWEDLDDETKDRQILLEKLVQDLRIAAGEVVPTVSVVLFKPAGKYYTEETWRMPKGATGPEDMVVSPDFRRIDGGAVLVESQAPWGYPFLISAVQ